MSAERPRVAILSAMRDEALNLLEWVAHHRAAGVDEFLIVSNDCSDGTDQMLDLLAEHGGLTHLRSNVPDDKTPQWAALKLAEKHPVLMEADWIAHLDCDEFLNLRAPLHSVHDLIGAVDADAIALPWRLFGHSGHATRPHHPTIRAYTRAIPLDAAFPPLGRFIKTLYRRAGPFQKPGVHRPRQVRGALPRWVDGSGARLPEAFAADPGRIMLWGAPLAQDLVQLNHYSVRSAEDFMAKRARGLPNHTTKPVDLTYWVERNFNTVHEPSITRMAPATFDELERLRALPGMAELEASAQNHHATAFARALRDPANLKFYGRLVLAADSTVPDAKMAGRLVALFRAANPDL